MIYKQAHVCHLTSNSFPHIFHEKDLKKFTICSRKTVLVHCSSFDLFQTLMNYPLMSHKGNIFQMKLDIYFSHSNVLY